MTEPTVAIKGPATVAGLETVELYVNEFPMILGEVLAIEAEAAAAEGNRIKRLLPLGPKSPLPADYARGWWDALNLCLDAIDKDRPRAVVIRPQP